MITLLAFVVGYFALLAVLALIARPYRVRLRAAAKYLLEDVSLTEAERSMVKTILASAYSIRTSPMLFLAFVIGVLRRSEQIDREADTFAETYPSVSQKYETWHTLLETHMVSAFATNPIFGVLAYLAKWILRAKARAYFVRTKRHATSFDLYEIKALTT